MSDSVRPCRRQPIRLRHPLCYSKNIKAENPTVCIWGLFGLCIYLWYLLYLRNHYRHCSCYCCSNKCSPASNVVPSPSVPHTAARVIFLKLECDHNTPLLKTLHWLPISLRMESLKIASCSGSCLHLQSHLPSVSPPPTARFYPTAHIFHPPLVPELFAAFQRHLILSLVPGPLHQLSTSLVTRSLSFFIWLIVTHFKPLIF